MSRIAANSIFLMTRESLKRWTLVVAGVVCVALGAIGAVLPVMPTAVFLIVGAWCFTRSCPRLEAVLIRNRFFKPFLVYLDRDTPMPLRAQIVALAAMWIAIAFSGVMIGLRTELNLAVVIPLLALSGAAGTWAILHQGRSSRHVRTPSAPAPSD